MGISAYKVLLRVTSIYLFNKFCLQTQGCLFDIVGGVEVCVGVRVLVFGVVERRSHLMRRELRNNSQYMKVSFNTLNS
jgi:hypothetical protein